MFVPPATDIHAVPVVSIVHAETVSNIERYASYTVRQDDTLSSIAISKYRDAADWTCIYDANSRAIGVNPNVIILGEHLRIPEPAPSHCKTPAMPAPALAPVTETVASVSTPQAVTPAQQAPVSSSSYSGSGGMQSCIIAAESGGNPGIWNASGHWGLYQFSYDTWVAHGGSPGDFGTASVAEQNQVYYNTVAVDGYSDWAPYDGC